MGLRDLRVHKACRARLATQVLWVQRALRASKGSRGRKGRKAPRETQGPPVPLEQMEVA